MKTTTKKNEWVSRLGNLVNFATRSVLAPIYKETAAADSIWSVPVLAGYDVSVDGIHVGTASSETAAKRMATRRWNILPPCAKSMRCLCAGHGWRGDAASAPCDTREQV